MSDITLNCGFGCSSIDGCNGHCERPVPVKLSSNQRKCLSAWKDQEDSGLHFAAIQKRSKLEGYLVRRTVRALARKGLTKYVNSLWTEDGDMYGAGYALTPAGRRAIGDDTQGG